MIKKGYSLLQFLCQILISNTVTKMSSTEQPIHIALRVRPPPRNEKYKKVNTNDKIVFDAVCLGRERFYAHSKRTLSSLNECN